MSEKKTKRVSLRMKPAVKVHLDTVAQTLGTSLSDLLVVGGMLIEMRAKNSVDYLKVKAEALQALSESNGS